MALIEFPGARGASNRSSIEPLHPCESKGVLFPQQEQLELEQFEATVERIVPKQIEEPDEWGNVLSRYRVEMTDGTTLGLNYLEPRERATDIAVIETPAWFTNLHGFNEHTQRALGNLGFPSLLVGHVGEERDSFKREAARLLMKPWRVARELGQISLARQAHNMLEIVQYGNFPVDDHAVFTHGNSRGAMVQFPLIAMAVDRGMSVPFAMPVAPCFHSGLSKERLLHHGRQLPNEALNIGRILTRNLFDMAGSGINTVNPSPKSLIYEIAHGPTLMRGDAGAFDAHIPFLQKMLIVSYEGDVAGQKEEWEVAFADHPHIFVRGIPGAHLSIADRRTRRYVTSVFGGIAEQTREGTPVSRLDLSHVKRSLRLVPDEAA